MALNSSSRLLLSNFGRVTERTLTNRTLSSLSPSLTSRLLDPFNSQSLRQSTSILPSSLHMSTELLQFQQQQPQQQQEHRLHQRKQQSRSVSTTSPLRNAEEPSSLAAGQLAGDDLSPIEDSSSPSSSSAASVIQAQVDEVLSSLPLTERLFAVIQIDGKQYRVSQDDVVTVEDW